MKSVIANLFVALCFTALLFQTAHSQRAHLQYKKAHKHDVAPNAYTSVFVMMPLDVINNDGQVKDPQGLYYKLQKIRDAGADGIMIDVWWGIVERNGPRRYDWEGYRQIFKICADLNLKIQAVMSFHKCGTNVGDACYIELPKFVRNIGVSNRDIYYTDRSGYRDEEYLTSGVNDVSIFPTADYSSAPNRTAVQMYSDLMSSFASNFSSILGRNKQIVEIEVGLGPAGELRYPSYQLQEGRWSFPGVGEFQCYDKYLLSQLKQAANSAGHPEWGNGGPSNAGSYNSRPYDTGFFSGGFDNYGSPYGRFFLDWYSRTLIQHGDRVLSEAVKIFNQYGASVAGKVAGIHWWYFDSSHAAELTAGYYNANQRDAYADIARMFQKNGVEFLFTCLEMRNADQHDCQCGPEDLVRQTRVAANSVGVGYSGENALPSYNEYQYSQIINQARYGGRAMNAFTYLRLDDTLLRDDNLGAFKYFVQRMHNL